MLDLPPLEKCYYDVPIANVAKKKPLGRINDVLIMVNNNLVPVDFLVMDVECNASYPIILGRPSLRTVGAIIDMRNIIYGESIDIDSILLFSIFLCIHLSNLKNIDF
jgi:hypothetical protein